MNSPSSKSYYILNLTVVATLIAAVRYIQLWGYPTATSNDAGVWLMSARAALGDQSVAFHTNSLWFFGQIPIYNLELPFIPVLPLAALAGIFGPFLGLKLFMVIASVLPLPAAVYLFVKMGVDRFTALVGGIIFVFIPSYATIFAWANFDGLFGLCFFLVALGSLISYLSEPSSNALLVTGLMVALTAGSDTMFFAVAVTTFVVFSGILAAKRQIWKALLVAKALLTGLVFSLPFAPIYVDMYLSRGAASSQFLSPLQVASTIYSSYIAVFPELSLTVLVGIVAVMCAFLVVSPRNHVQLGLVWSTIIASVLLVFSILAYRAVRFWYIIPIPVFLIGVLFFSQLNEAFTVLKLPYGKRASKALTIVLMIILVGAGFTGTLLTQNAYRFYEDLDQPKLNAISWLSANTPSNATVVSSAANPNSPHFNYWVSGLADRRAIGEEYAFLPNTPDLTYSQEQRQAHLASLALKGNLALENGEVMLADGFPYDAPYRPLIGIYVGDYQPVAFFDWRHTDLSLEASSGLNTLVSLPSLQQSSNYTVSQSADAISASYSYGGAVMMGGAMKFTESLPYGGQYADFTFSWSNLSLGSLPSGLDPAIGLMVPTGGFTTHKNSATLWFETKFGTHVNGSLSLAGPSSVVEFSFVTANSTLSFIQMHIGLVPSQSGSFTFRLGFATAINPQPLKFYDFRSIQAELGLNYALIFVSRLMQDRFIECVGTLVFQNTEIEIFRVPSG